MNAPVSLGTASFEVGHLLHRQRKFIGSREIAKALRDFAGRRYEHDVVMFVTKLLDQNP